MKTYEQYVPHGRELQETSSFPERRIDLSLLEELLAEGERLFGAHNTSEHDYCRQHETVARPVISSRCRPLFFASSEEPVYFAYYRAFHSRQQETRSDTTAALSTTQHAHAEVPFKTETIYHITPEYPTVAVREWVNSCLQPTLQKPQIAVPLPPYAYRKIRYDIQPSGQLHGSSLNLDRRDEGYTMHLGRKVFVRHSRLFVYSKDKNSIVLQEHIAYSQPKGRRRSTLTIEANNVHSSEEHITIEFGSGDRTTANKTQVDGVTIFWYDGQQHELETAKLLPRYQLLFTPQLTPHDVFAFVDIMVQGLKQDWSKTNSIYSADTTKNLVK
jgi:hypothetical protein